MLKRILLIIFLFLLLPNAHGSANPMEPNKQYVLLDTSGSMRGAKLEQAKEILVQALRDADISAIKIYTFAGQQTPTILSGETKSELESKILQTTAGSRTSLYDSIFYLVSQNETRGQRILVLSDVADSESKKSIAELLNSLQSSSTEVSFIASLIDSRHIEDAQRITNASGGVILQEFLWPEPKPSNAASPKEEVPSNNSNLLLLGISAGSSLLSALLVVRSKEFMAARKRRGEMKELITPKSSQLNDSADELSGVKALIHRIYYIFDLDTYFRSARTKAAFLFGSLVVASGLYRFTESLLITGVMTTTLVFLFLTSKRKGQENKVIREFETELPGALKMLASSLASGLSFLQALSAYAEEGHGQSAKEFKRALAEIQLGVPVERALESVAKRMKSDDLRWAVSAFALQREVGGSLATILNSTAETIESRFELRREVRTLSAEGRISSYILMLLPIGIFIFLTFLRPSYVQLFVTEPIGNLLISLVIVALIAAWFWLKSIIRIEV